MLVLGRTKKESIIIGKENEKDVLSEDDKVEVTIIDIRGDRTRFGFSYSTKGVSLHRTEIYAAIMKEITDKPWDPKVLDKMKSTIFKGLKKDATIIIGLEDQADVIDVEELVEIKVLNVVGDKVDLEIKHPEGLSVLAEDEYDSLMKKRKTEADDKGTDNE